MPIFLRDWLHMGPVTSATFAVILPVLGDANAFRVLVSVLQTVIESFGYHMLVKDQHLGN